MTILTCLCLALAMVSSSCPDHPVKPTAYRVSAGLEDTLVIAQNLTGGRLDSSRPFLQARLESNGKQPTSPTTYLILLRNLRMTSAPEGVYELYLTAEKTTAGNLKPSGSHFVQVIDTYQLNNSTGVQQFRYDVSGHVKSLTARTKNPTFFVSILFRGNLSADRKKSGNAGNLLIESIALLGTR